MDVDLDVDVVGANANEEFDENNSREPEYANEQRFDDGLQGADVNVNVNADVALDEDGTQLEAQLESEDGHGETRLLVEVPNKQLFVNHNNVVDIQVVGFSIDTRFQIELLSPRGEDSPVIIRRKADGNYQVAFMPETPGKYTLSLYRDSHDNPELQHELDVEAVSHRSLSLKMEMTPAVQALNAAYCLVSIVDAFKTDELFRVMINDPEGEFISYTTEMVEEGILFEFVPVKIGRYRAQAYYNNRLVENSVAHCLCFDSRKVRLTEADRVGPVNTEMSLTIDCSEAGEPYGVQVIVKSASGEEIPVVCGERDALGDGMMRFRYEPKSVEEHVIYVNFNRFEVAGSPISVQVTPPAPNVTGQRNASGVQARLGDLVWVHFDPKVVPPRESEIEVARASGNSSSLVQRGFEVKLTAPDGSAPPYSCAKKKNRVVVIEFNPKMLGRYVVNVYHKSDNAEAPGSPFIIDVVPPSQSITQPTLQSDARAAFTLAATPQGTGTEARKVKVTLEGTGLRDAQVNEDASFELQLIGDLDAIREQPIVKVVKLDGRNASELQVAMQRLDTGKYRFTYRPTEGGSHKLHVMLGANPIRGSPFDVHVHEQQPVAECFVNDTYGLQVGFAEPIVDLQQVQVTAIGPSGPARCEIMADASDSQLHIINVTPLEAGKHVVEVKMNGVLLPELGILLTAKHVKPAHAVRVHGDGVTSGTVMANQPRRNFFCDTRGAGKGQLSCRILSPRGNIRAVLTRLKRRGDDAESKANRRVECYYDALSDGQYTVELYWRSENGDLEPVPRSPFNFEVKLLGQDNMTEENQSQFDQSYVEQPQEESVLDFQQDENIPQFQQQEQPQPFQEDDQPQQFRELEDQPEQDGDGDGDEQAQAQAQAQLPTLDDEPQQVQAQDDQPPQYEPEEHQNHAYVNQDGSATAAFDSEKIGSDSDVEQQV